MKSGDKRSNNNVITDKHRKVNSVEKGQQKGDRINVTIRQRIATSKRPSGVDGSYIGSPM